MWSRGGGGGPPGGVWARGRGRASREPTPCRPRSTGGRLVGVATSSSSLGCELDEAVLYAPPRRRLTTGSHAEFVGALVHEFRSALASLKDPGELATRVAWLVRLLEAV